MKILFRRFIACACLLNLTLSCAFAALSPTRSFSGADFTDVPDDWSHTYIATCYELGLMSGRGKGIFGPAGNLSVAEGIMVAARVHNLWLGGSGEFPDDDSWYSGAVSYALNAGIIVAGEFPDYSAFATRTQVAVLLSRALPQEDYTPINAISSLPDVERGSLYASNILTLYNAGILTGTDSYGTFSPDAPITRAELAATLCRLVQPETRLQFTLQSPYASSIFQLDDVTFEQTINLSTLTAVLFSADWCQSCQLFSPTFDLLVAQYGDRVKFGRVDIDQQTEWTSYYNINSIPTVILFQNGQEVDRIENNNPFDTYANFLDSRL